MQAHENQGRKGSNRKQSEGRWGNEGVSVDLERYANLSKSQDKP